MPLIYAKHFPHFLRREDDLIPEEYVLFFDPVSERLQNTIGDRFRRVDPSIRNNVDLVIFRGRTSNFIENLQKDPDLKDLLGKIPAVALVGCIDAQKAPEYVTIPAFPKPEKALPSLEILRESEIHAILGRAGAVFAPENHHFVLPSGLHASKFVRLADALQDPIEIARISDWILQYVTPNTVIVGDTGSLLPLLLMIQLESFRRFGWDISIRTINEYPAQTESLVAVINDAELKLGLAGGHILFLVSVNSSGSLIKQVRSIAHHDLYTYTIVIVCDTGVGEHPDKGTVVLSSLPIERWRADECELCDESNCIGIDPRTYERIPSLEWKPIHITPRIAGKHHDFWEAVDEANAASLHVDRDYPEAEGGQIRHHGIYIDIVRLTANTWFRNEIVRVLQTIDPPSVIIFPKHSATDTLRNIVAEVHNKATIIVIQHCSLDEQAKAKLMSLSETDSVLIVDDALVSGTTLHRMREVVYLNTRNSRPRVRAFVFLARPEFEETFSLLSQRYRDNRFAIKTQFMAGYSIYLPYECPWCMESEVLQRYLPRLDEQSKKYATVRIEKLKNKLGLSPPFLIGTEGDTGGERKTQGSIFGNLGVIAAFSAVTGACQELRQSMNSSTPILLGSSKRTSAGVSKIQNAFSSRIKKVFSGILGKSKYINQPRIHNSGSVIYVVDLKKVLNFHFDSVLLSAMLRTFSLRELQNRGQENAVIEALKFKHPNRVDPGTIAELGWAAVNRKIPHHAALDLLHKDDKNDPCISMLVKLLSLTIN